MITISVAVDIEIHSFAEQTFALRTERAVFGSLFRAAGNRAIHEPGTH